MNKKISKKSSQRFERRARCESCNFWMPNRKTKIRNTWGTCLPRGMPHKWTCSCIAFIRRDQIVKDGVIFLKKNRFKRSQVCIVGDLVIILF